MAKRRSEDSTDARHGLSNDFVAALARDWEANGINTIETLRNTDPKAYCQLIATVVPKELLVASDRTAETNAPKDSDEIARRLLADVGLEYPNTSAKSRALQAYDLLIATLQGIADEAIGPLQ